MTASSSDPPLCGADGCTTVPSPSAGTAMSQTTQIDLSIVSDTICPWCYVGKRRLERAIDALAPEGITVTLRWLPFELNPTMPAEGMDRRVYRSAKFGSWEHSQALDAQVAAEGAREGIVFRHELITRTPNTRLSHRLIWLAGDLGGPMLQNQVVEELFFAYFCQGRDIGEGGVLMEIGQEAGLQGERLDALLAGDEGLEEVRRHEAWAGSIGIRGVPSVVAGEKLVFSGALRTPLIVSALREIALPQAAGAAAS